MKSENLKIALFVETKEETSTFETGVDYTIDVSLCSVPENGETYPSGKLPDGLDNMHFIIRGGTWQFKSSEGKTAWNSGVTICFNNLYFAGLNDMDAKTKTLRSIHAKLDKLTERFGYAETPFALLARFADVVKADVIYFRNDREEISATGEKFRARTRADGLSQIAHEARKLADKLTAQAIAA